MSIWLENPSPKFQAAFARAIKRAREQKPLVKPKTIRTYSVRSSGGDDVYVVRFFKQAGRKCAACDCPAGFPLDHKFPMICKHVAAAAGLHLHLCALRASGQPLPFIIPNDDLISHPATPAPSASPEAARDADAPPSAEAARAIAQIERQMRPAIEKRRERNRRMDEAILMTGARTRRRLSALEVFKYETPTARRTFSQRRRSAPTQIYARRMQRRILGSD